MRGRHRAEARGHPQVVLNKLYKHTQMQTTFGVIILALVGGVPRTLTLPEMLQALHRPPKEVVIRRTKFELEKAEERAHILEGLRIALDNLDQVISIIRRARRRHGARRPHGHVRAHAAAGAGHPRHAAPEAHRPRARQGQGGARRAARAHRGTARAARRRGRRPRRHQGRAGEIKRLYNDDRRTEIVPDEGEIDLEDLIAEEQMAITITKTGYVKRIPVATYRQQKRGGIGVAGMDLKEEDEVEHLFITSTHNYLLFFTSVGKVYRLKVHELPLAGRNAKGKHIVNLLPLRQDEKICAVINTRNFEASDGKYLILGTRSGIVKKTLFASYDTSSRPTASSPSTSARTTSCWRCATPRATTTS